MFSSACTTCRGERASFRGQFSPAALSEAAFLVLSLPVCGDLSKYGPYRFMCLIAWPIVSGTIMGWGLIGKGVAFWSLCGGRL